MPDPGAVPAANALMSGRLAAGLSLPIGPGVSVVGQDDLPAAETRGPPLAAVRMDQSAMARAGKRPGRALAGAGLPMPA